VRLDLTINPYYHGSVLLFSYGMTGSTFRWIFLDILDDDVLSTYPGLQSDHSLLRSLRSWYFVSDDVWTKLISE
jgi:hypothetical protein